MFCSERSLMARLYCVSLDLKVETCRYVDIPRTERKYIFYAKHEVEDEAHDPLRCSA